MIRPSLAVVGLCLLVPASSFAQSAGEEACQPGQTVRLETAGHCCWTGQAWSTARGVCEGVPLCPLGTQASGETCVAGGAAASTATGGAGAGQCPVGQSVTLDTGGHCCWPGQAWSNARQSCVGTPSCPLGTSAQGETCVGGGVLQSGGGLPHERQPYTGGPIPPGAHVVSETHWSFLLGGFGMFAGGWLIAGATAAAAGSYVSSHPTRVCLSSAHNAVYPVVGPILALTEMPRYDPSSRTNCADEAEYSAFVALAVVDTALQVAGLTLAFIGVLTPNRYLDYTSATVSTRAGRFRLSVVPGAPSATLGATLSIVQF